MQCAFLVGLQELFLLALKNYFRKKKILQLAYVECYVNPYAICDYDPDFNLLM